MAFPKEPYKERGCHADGPDSLPGMKTSPLLLGDTKATTGCHQTCNTTGCHQPCNTNVFLLNLPPKPTSGSPVAPALF